MAGVESATHISQLNSSNPATADSRREGDDHLRLIKAVLLTDFANINAAVTASAAELNYLDLTAAIGTATASEAVVLDANKDFNFGTGDITATNITSTGTGTIATADINGGNIDNTAIGGTTPAAGAFTTLTNSGTLTLGADISAANNDIDNCKTVQFNGEYDNGNAGAADTIAMDNGQKQKSTLNAATVTLTLTEPTSVGNWVLKLVGTSGSAPTITWATTGAANVYWAGGGQPTWSTDGTDLVALYYDGTNFYCQSSIGFA